MSEARGATPVVPGRCASLLCTVWMVPWFVFKVVCLLQRCFGIADALIIYVFDLNTVRVMQVVVPLPICMHFEGVLGTFSALVMQIDCF